MGFAELNRKARLLEQNIEQKIDKFSRLFKSLNNSQSISVDQASLERQLHNLLEDIEKDINELLITNDDLHSIYDEPLSAVQNFAIERHQSQCNDIQHEFRKISRLLKENGMREELLGGPMQTRDANDPRMMNQESENRLLGANIKLQQMLIQGKNTREEFGDQRHRFNNVDLSLGGMNTRFPVINNILSRIMRRQRRDRIILSAVIAFFIVAFIVIVF